MTTFHQHLNESLIGTVKNLFAGQPRDVDDMIKKLLSRDKRSGLALLTKQGFSQQEARFFMTEIRNIASQVVKKLNMDLQLDDNNFHGLVLPSKTPNNKQKESKFETMVLQQFKKNTNRR